MCNEIKKYSPISKCVKVLVQPLEQKHAVTVIMHHAMLIAPSAELQPTKSRRQQMCTNQNMTQAPLQEEETDGGVD